MGTKDTVLELLERNRGFFVSGEKIAADLNISRTAVWKAVKKLQSEGYEIKAITNRGYCLAKDSDILSVQGICHRLSDECSMLRPEVFVTVDSTNRVCRDKANDGEAEGYVAVAGSQTRGRGRSGRGFFSPAETGIYMSILLRPKAYHGLQVLRLTTMAAVAVCEAVESMSDKKAEIKWVNDVYVNGRKVCGILTEGSYGLEDGAIEAAVVGIGINAYPPKGGFPEEIADKAGCIFDESSVGKRNMLAAEVLNRFMHYYNDPSADDYVSEYTRRSIVIGRDVILSRHGRNIKARVLGLDGDCGLIVRYEDGSEDVVRSGEVSIVGIS